MREVTPTRSSALALGDERKLMRQGYEFLDEKRTLLAGEILRRLALYQELTRRFAVELADAAAKLAAAVERHGLDNLQAYPARDPPLHAPTLKRTAFLGVAIISLGEAEDDVRETKNAFDPSPEAEACRAAFERLARTAAEAGIEAGNLHRLAREYRRTERRAKALENVLLPEIDDAIKRVDEQLDTMDREEAVRIRWSSGAKAL
jgi:V/A-type H+-transporting ATPase subunit D